MLNRQPISDADAMDLRSEYKCNVSLLARAVGVLYLVIIVCGISSEVFIRTSLIDFNDAIATSLSLKSSSFLFHLGLLLDVVMLLADVAKN